MSAEGSKPSLNEFLNQLDENHVHYILRKSRPDAVMVEVLSVPAEHWEIEFMDDGNLEIERFRSMGQILDASALNDLWKLLE